MILSKSYWLYQLVPGSWGDGAYRDLIEALRRVSRGLGLFDPKWSVMTWSRDLVT